MLNFLPGGNRPSNEIPEPQPQPQVRIIQPMAAQDKTFANTRMQAKLDDALERGRTIAAPTVAKILREARDIEDYLTPLNDTNIRLVLNENKKLAIVGSDFTEKTFSPHALRQFGEMLGVRSPKDIRNYGIGKPWEVEAAIAVYAAHLENAGRDKPVMLRITDGRVRAVVSNSYGRYDSTAILQEFVNVSQGNNAEITRADLTDQRWYLEMLRPEIVNIETDRNGDVPAVFGASLGNSDFGSGSVELRLFVLNLVCMNGMVGQSLIRKVHIGEAITSNEALLSAETIRKRTEFFTSSMQDILGHAFADEVVKRSIRNIQDKAKTIIDPSATVGKMVKTKTISSTEADAILHRLLNGSVADGLVGDPTEWKLANAVTAIARDVREQRQVVYVNAKGTDQRLSSSVGRARELEAIAGNMILEPSAN